MQCPNCHVDLQGIDYAGVHIDTCPQCGGDWLDAGELGTIAEARKSRFTAEECLAIAQAATIHGIKMRNLNRTLTCPSCGGATYPVNYGEDSGIIIDKCTQCNGVWLEKGELDKIEELVEGWDDGLPQDLAKYGPKLRAVAAQEAAFEQVHISHSRLINSMINGILDLIGD